MQQCYLRKACVRRGGEREGCINDSERRLSQRKDPKKDMWERGRVHERQAPVKYLLLLIIDSLKRLCSLIGGKGWSWRAHTHTYTHLWESLCSWFPVTQAQREGERAMIYLREIERERMHLKLKPTWNDSSCVCSLQGIHSRALESVHLFISDSFHTLRKNDSLDWLHFFFQGEWLQTIYMG